MSAKSKASDKSNRVIIFDTTLRDGEQAPGATLNIDEKLEIARQLERLGVDVIEAGFPIASPGDFEAVRLIAKELKQSTVCALAHANVEAIDRAWEAVKGAKKKRIHVFLSSSDIHLNYQLKKGRDEMLKLACDMVAHAKKYTGDIEFSPMDATRTDPAFIYRITEAVIEAGATTVNIPDTVGYTTPQEFNRLIVGIFKNVSNIGKAVISVHCHDDLGLAVANSLTALRAGARQVECTVNGIGERAGNASMEEIVMALRTRKDSYKLTTNIDTTQIYRASRMVSELTGFAIPPNKAIVGGNAFRHESGIHQDGVIKERTTYEIMDARDVGWPSSALVLGKHSGRHALKNRLEKLGYSLSDEELGRAFTAFKELADKKKEITNRDLESLVAEEKRTTTEAYHLEHVQVSCGDGVVPTATVKLIAPDGKVVADAALGMGPVDAIYKAINRLVRVQNRLIEFSVTSVTEGIDAIGEVTIRIESDGMVYTGRGAATDIVVASAKAYMNALNRLLAAKGNE
ncbi:MAG: 2-isopropylmalate synthase [Chloroflexota bacterium]|nr:2-isopropylmalate synthase [Chloroflexota bacterium]